MSRVLALFDVDGTLTVPRKQADDAMKTFMRDLRSKVTVGIVGGSDLVKISRFAKFSQMRIPIRVLVVFKIRFILFSRNPLLA